MTRILLPILISILFLPFCFCTKERYYDPELLAIDTLLQTRPDSAYIRLEQFDTKRLTHKSDSALYALLNAEARYKNYIDDTASSTLKKAEEFFRSENDSYNLMRTLYYKGLICQNKGSNGEALVAFDEALENADNSQLFYKAHLYQAIARGASIIHDNKMELYASQEAYNLFKKLDSIPFIQESQLILGKSLVDNNNMKGINFIKEIVQQSWETKDTILLKDALTYLSLAFLHQANYKEAKQSLQLSFSLYNINEIPLKDKNLLLWAMIKDNTAPDSILNLANSIMTEYSKEDVTYEFYESQGDFENAFKSLKKEYVSYNRQYARDISSDANFLRSIFKEKRLHSVQKELGTTRQLILWIGASFGLILVCIGLIIFLIIWSKNNKIRNAIDTVGILTQSLNEYKQNITDSLSKSSPTLDYLLVRLDNLYSEYYRSPETQQNSKGVMCKIKEEIEHIRSSMDFLESLEKEINKSTNNLLSDVYNNMKRINENQRRLGALLFFHFSIDSICLILDIKPDVFYNRKSRLKKSLLNSNSNRKDELYNLLFPSEGEKQRNSNY